MLGIRLFPFGAWPIFKGVLVRFRECSWWFQPPSWTICSSNWIIFPRLKMKDFWNHPALWIRENPPKLPYNYIVWSPHQKMGNLMTSCFGTWVVWTPFFPASVINQHKNPKPTAVLGPLLTLLRRNPQFFAKAELLSTRFTMIFLPYENGQFNVHAVLNGPWNMKYTTSHMIGSMGLV